MSHKLFVNLPVERLERSVAFYTALGFSFDPRFTDDSATCMLVGEDAYAMLLVRERFAGFTDRRLVDASSHAQALLGLSCESREAVDAMVAAAVANGGADARHTEEHGFMYGRSFSDPDGHVWEPFWMDAAAVEQGPHAYAEAAGQAS